MKHLEKIREADLKWLRAASLEHDGHLPGMPWKVAEKPFERLQRYGLVDRRDYGAFKPGEVHHRAVITLEGRLAIIETGRLLQARAAALPKPAKEEADF